MTNVILTFKDDVNLFLKNGAFFLALGVVLIILIAILLIIFLGKRNQKK